MSRGPRRMMLLPHLDGYSQDGEPSGQNRLDAYRRLLAEAVRALPPEQREAVELYFYRGLPLRLAAREASVSISTCWRRLEAAKKGLRRMVEVCARAGLLPR